MRPACCPRCAGPVEQELPERLDIDGIVWVGSIVCRACEARWIYMARRPTPELLHAV